MAGLYTLGSPKSYYLLRTQNHHDTSKIYQPKFHETGLSDDTQYLYCGCEDNTERSEAGSGRRWTINMDRPGTWCTPDHRTTEANKARPSVSQQASSCAWTSCTASKEIR
jgi:hypothetical protein